MTLQLLNIDLQKQVALLTIDRDAGKQIISTLRIENESLRLLVASAAAGEELLTGEEGPTRESSGPPTKRLRDSTPSIHATSSMNAKTPTANTSNLQPFTPNSTPRHNTPPALDVESLRGALPLALAMASTAETPSDDRMRALTKIFLRSLAAPTPGPGLRGLLPTIEVLTNLVPLPNGEGEEVFLSPLARGKQKEGRRGVEKDGELAKRRTAVHGRAIFGRELARGEFATVYHDVNEQMIDDHGSEDGKSTDVGQDNRTGDDGDSDDDGSDDEDEGGEESSMDIEE